LAPLPRGFTGPIMRSNHPSSEPEAFLAAHPEVSTIELLRRKFEAVVSNLEYEWYLRTV
jgi:hypothetical protein